MSSNSEKSAEVGSCQTGSRGTGSRGFPSKCKCGLNVIRYTSKTHDNPGRPFFRCPTKEADHTFKWVEDAVFEEVEEALPKLGLIEGEMWKSKAEIQELKAVIEELKEDVLKSKKEFKNWKLVITVCLFLIFIVLLCWILLGKSSEQGIVLGY